MTEIGLQRAGIVPLGPLSASAKPAQPHRSSIRNPARAARASELQLGGDHKRLERVRCAGHSCSMKRYYFDIREGDQLAADEEGLMMRDIDAVQKEAAQSLADMARDAVSGRMLHRMAIEVRDDIGPVLEVRYRWQIRRLVR